jgi:ornithine cyclodeaminase/alanine dehydrogenase-like protein (mu-crystallin family)
MTTVYSRAQIAQVIRPKEVIAAMERAFAAYSNGEAVIPPVGQLDFEDPPGDCHIKYGYLKQGSTFTIKIATGFWKNPERGLASSNGVVLVFSSETGELLTIFQDEGYLTDMRTAAAGAVAAKYLAPQEIGCIGIIGAGLQARLQLDYLREVTPCRRVKLWARAMDRARALTVPGFDIEVVASPSAVAADARLIVTTTASRAWLLGAADVKPGTHITALGADGGGKQELEPQLLALAQIRAVDSVSQCSKYGDSAFALEQGLIETRDLVELGRVIQDPALRRRSAQDISIADLTGVAVQDMAIAELALQRLRSA